MALSIEKDVGFESRERSGDFLRAWLSSLSWSPHDNKQKLKRNELAST
jgi:hypothetical protein